MDIIRWAGLLKNEFYKWGTLNAFPRNASAYCDVLDSVQAMTSPSNMLLLNLAVQCMSDQECYLEVGTWRGGTFIGALLGNDARGIAIDDDTMDEHDNDTRSSQEVWWENVRRYGMEDRAEYVNCSVPAVWRELGLRTPVGVYLFDGDKATVEAAYEGIAGIIPYLSDQALIVVDDANTIQIRQAVAQFCHDHADHAYTLLDIPTYGNCWPCFWDGVIVIAWKA